MTTAVQGALPKTSAIGVGVVPLLALAVFINYVDRGTVSPIVAMPEEPTMRYGAVSA